MALVNINKGDGCHYMCAGNMIMKEVVELN